MEKVITDLIKDYIRSSSLYKSFVKNPLSTFHMKGLEGYPLTRLAEIVQRKSSGRIIFLTPTDEIAREAYQDFSDITDIPVIYFPSSGKKLYSPSTASAAEYAQSRALGEIENLKQGIIVTGLRAFASPVISRSSLSSLSLELRAGAPFRPMELAEKLSAAGYFRQGSCYEVGTYSIRGEVMEIFPFGEENPVRIYASWDEIEKMAFYDPITQKALKNLSRYSLSLMSQESETESEPFTSYLKTSDYLFYVGSSRMEVSFRSLMNEAKALFKEAYQENPDAVLPDKLLSDPMAYASSKHAKMVAEDIMCEDCHVFDIQGARSYFGNVTYFKEELEGLIRNRYRTVIVAPSLVQKERLDTVLRDYPEAELTVSEISHGFTIDAVRLAVILDAEIFGRRKVKAEKNLVNVSSAPIDSFVDLKEGDFVVHVNYGIGQFVRIERAKTTRSERDYIKIRYANDEFLYVPIEQADLVQRYIGSDGRKPKLDAMGGTGWTRKKQRALKNAEELAGHLIKLYAARQNSFGFPFLPDNDWQLQFEASFPFTETPDQLKCIEDIKRDMESDRVMDRLVCGDVGYGKTEIAFRAAFKAVMSGKQVAFLAPTTILAEQHYRKFRERVANFPVNVEMLSRIVSTKEQRRILAALKDGKVDVLFGTHKILQKSVVYKNLGLLVVDEEQRFGVKDKEKIKQLKVNVDCLTLSATPIPRTLYMSLLKVRDMSLLTTAPRERLPVSTVITDYNINRVVNAIRKELERGGQVFYLHNRIQDLSEVAYQLRMLIPEAIIEYAHGQMDPDELEDIMHRFVYEGVQVLVSTTIIENGIDIPNVNTIIIDNAERFGLSQLYQLRGRVGRSDRQAYCYLFYPSEDMLNDDAVKRLKVLSEHTSLGSGFKVAMKDMEIRGAGNILGQEQSGELEAVGLDMYMKILDEEITRQTHGEKSHEEREVYLELDYSGFIPDTYIRDPATKFEVYKKISSVRTDYELEALRGELEDRFGAYPVEVDNLFCIAQIKILCRKLEIYHLSESRGFVQVEFSHLAAIKPDKIINLLRLSNGRVKMDSSRMNYMKMQTDAVSLKDKALFILEQLKRLE